MKRSTKDPNVFLDRLIMKNIAEFALEKNFKTSDQVSLNILCEIVKQFVGKLADITKDSSELNGRSESNMIDALSGIFRHSKINQKQIIQHIKKKPFKYECWNEGLIEKIMSEQQEKADNFIKTHFKHTLPNNADDSADGCVELPENIKNFKGLPAIPPFLRNFPSNLSLQSMKKIEYKDKEEKSTSLKIKNKREVEDKLVEVTLPPPNLEEKVIPKQPDSKPDQDNKEKHEHPPKVPEGHSQEENKTGIEQVEDIFNESQHSGDENKASELLKKREDDIPEEILEKYKEEKSEAKIKKRTRKGVMKIKESKNLFV
ncbi:unnamed protein product [Moneuplotes crassus]|uniref:Bromodomain associated domain-containing protein n=1 Tax=Euplotes crassus TaxID=5936 RepID=A0AAD2CZR2_EUPCR|nr:unnamed protein product [Moneuplotes crassus]